MSRSAAFRVLAGALLVAMILVGVLLWRSVGRLPDSLVYFVRSEEATMTLEAVGRRGPGTTPEERLATALAALIEGPSPEEEARGLTSALPPDTRVLALELENDLVSVDLSADFERGGGTAMMTGRLEQLFYTLSQPREVNRVALFIEGERVRVFGGEGLMIANPWRRPEGGTLPRW